MSTRPRQILFITGIRSEYDILHPIITALENRPDTQPSLIITGAHLTPTYGHTDSQIQADGHDILARLETLLNSDTPAARVKSAANQLSGLVDLLSQHRPAIVVAPTDREEALTVAIAGAYMGIPVAHIGGGDHADDCNIDNAVRHAVTKLSHLHLVTTQRSAERVVKLGEEPWRVHVVGAPGLDRMAGVEKMTRAALGERLGADLTEGPVAVVIQHSVSTDVEAAGRHMKTTLAALAPLGLKLFISYPNSDAGSHLIIRAIQEFAASHPGTCVHRNLPREVFVNLLRTADVLVGNSSCGIIEAPLLKLPVVNVGPRQVGREHADNVIFVEHDEARVRAAVQKALHDGAFKTQVRNCVNPYGDGHAGERIAEVLAETPLDARLIEKRHTY